MFWIEANTQQAEHKFQLAALAAEDLDEPMTRFGKYLRARAIERYKAQAFPGLAQSTIEKRAQKGLRQLERKLHRDVRRAMGRARGARGQRHGLLTKLFSSSAMRHALEDQLSSQTRGVQNRQAVLGAFQARHRRDLKQRLQGKKLSFKQEVSLSDRESRAVARAVGQPVLGGLPRTVGFVVSDGTVTLRSATHELWSETHNKGGTVGHGASLPQRETIVLEDRDIEVLVSILKDHHLLPFQEGMHGPGY